MHRGGFAPVPKMRITSIETVARDNQPSVVLVPRLEELGSQEVDAGFTWKSGALIDSALFSADSESDLGLDVLDLPYSFERSPFISAGETETGLTLNRDQWAYRVPQDLLGEAAGFAPANVWTVAGMASVGSGMAEVALTSLAGGSVVAAMYEDDTALVLPGAPVLGVERVLRGAEHRADAGAGAAAHTPVDLGRKYVLRFFGVSVDFLPDRPAIKTDALLPIVRLHCPRLEGCRAEYTASKSEGGSQGATISVLGSGGEFEQEDHAHADRGTGG
jgi:hypothetical protein